MNNSHLHPNLLFFFFNDTATTEIYTLSLHDALPICYKVDETFAKSAKRFELVVEYENVGSDSFTVEMAKGKSLDRKSTRLNSSHQIISYAVFCLKKKKKGKRGSQS